MRLVIFGLTVSSSWGNGHATLWRGLCRALATMGHRVVFFEKDVPYYARHRDLARPQGWRLCLYRGWEQVRGRAEAALRNADVGMVTSYCPDGIAATELLLSLPVPVRCFYDMDTPVTLQRVRAGEPVAYLGPRGLAGFDLVLSYTGGAALSELQTRLGAARVLPLYGSADPAMYRHAHRHANGNANEHGRPGSRAPRFAASYLGTYAPDRQPMLERLFFAPARRLPGRAFVLGGALYPADLDWPGNVRHRAHVPPPAHPAFYGSAALTVNVTRAPMARMGYCPSGRLFEAAACGVPVLSDCWQGLERFFEPGREILVARSTEDALAALCLPAAVLARVGRAARQRVLAEHTAATRARALVTMLESSPDAPVVPPIRLPADHADHDER